MDFGTDHDDGLGPIAGDEGVGEIEAVQEPPALLSHLERGHRTEAGSLLDERCVSGCEVIWCHRRRDQRIDRGGSHAGIGKGGNRRVHSELDGADAGFGHAASAYPGPLLDPRIGGVHDLGQIVVRDDGRRQRHAASDDHRPHANYSDSAVASVAAGGSSSAEISAGSSSGGAVSGAGVVDDAASEVGSSGCSVTRASSATAAL